MATFAEAFIQTFLPSRCRLCEESLPLAGSRAGVCARCWSSLAPHRTDGCPRCGDPDSVLQPCLSCRSAPPPWTAAASYSAYEGSLRSLVLALKNRRWDELAAPLADLLIVAFERQAWPAPDAVVSVPTSLSRGLRRGFDQAELLARRVAARLEVPFQAALRRHGRARQVGKARAARLQLPTAAFSSRRPVDGRVLLIDDVFTTGTTAARCSRVLLAAGADEVFVLTLARTPQSRRIP